MTDTHEPHDAIEPACSDRVFLDANVLFSAAYRQESRLAALWELEHTEILSSHYAAEEARRNLPIERLEYFEGLMAGVVLIGEPRHPWTLPEEISLPSNDRPILGAALRLGATHLLSGDRKAFGAYYGKSIAGVLVLRPADYLRARLAATDYPERPDPLSSP